MTENLQLLSNLIKKTVETIPGVVGFSFLDDDNKEDSIIINMLSNNKLEIRISIIITQNIMTKTLSKQIYESVLFVLKKHNFILDKLNLYIRGVK